MSQEKTYFTGNNNKRQRESKTNNERHGNNPFLFFSFTLGAPQVPQFEFCEANTEIQDFRIQ